MQSYDIDAEISDEPRDLVLTWSQMPMRTGVSLRVRYSYTNEPTCERGQGIDYFDEDDGSDEDSEVESDDEEVREDAEDAAQREVFLKADISLARGNMERMRTEESRLREENEVWQPLAIAERIRQNIERARQQRLQKGADLDASNWPTLDQADKPRPPTTSPLLRSASPNRESARETAQVAFNPSPSGADLLERLESGQPPAFAARTIPHDLQDVDEVYIRRYLGDS
jgi:hypothetical protein